VVSSTVDTDRPHELASVASEPQVIAHVDRPTPPRSGRWLLAVITFLSYLGIQFLVLIVAIVVLSSNGQLDATSQESLMLYLQSQSGLLLALAATAIAAVVTILVGFVWPSLWGGMLNGGRYSLADWLAWRPLKYIPGWLIVMMTAPLVVVMGLAITALFGDSSVDAQMMLFEGPLLQYLTPVVVALIVPLAEEIVFRGALYNAVLPRSTDPNDPEAGWQRHIVPFVVTSIAFGLVHLAAGFEKTGSIVQIMLLSMYLTGLRSYTGSMKASVIGHMTWNSFGAIVIVLYNMGLIPENF
jgi:membrane protease YdiL (CAAX protease family)